jgi:hyperosmotically inducible periplasmic protein
MTRRSLSVLVLLGLTGLAGCVQNPGNGPVTGAPPAHSQMTVDSLGRVVRLRAERNWDDSIGREALSALRDDDGETFRGVSVLAWDGGVLLAGAVTKPEQRRRAEQLVRSVEGVTQVYDELALAENPGLPQYVPDVAMEQRIYAGLLGQDAVLGAYVVRVVNNIAYLQGSTRSKADAERAVEFARDFDGIKWVVNHISVR